MAAPNRNASVRAQCWREEEILDLLAIWGEERIQEALRTSHRNIDCFAKVAEQMAARGHRRTAIECRSKSKTMRLEYKRVVAHNSISGNAPTTCPYYRELDRILRGDASVKPRRVARSIVITPRPALSVLPLQLREGSEELFSHEMIPANNMQPRASTPLSPERSSQDDSELARETDSDATYVEHLEQGRDVVSSVGDGQGVAPAIQETPGTPTSARSGSQGVSQTDQGAQTPGTRLRNMRERKRRPPGMMRVAEQMMAQSSVEHKENIQERRDEHEEAKRWHDEEISVQKTFIEETRLERIDLNRVWSQNMEVMLAAASTLQNLGEVIARMQQRMSSLGPSSVNIVSGTRQERENLPKRACVGRPRDRLTM